MNNKNLVHITLALIAGYSVRFWVDADPAIQNGLSIFIIAGWLWVSEALHISVTAMLIPVLAVLSGLCVWFSMLALHDIYHGDEPSLALGWQMVRVSYLVFLSFLASVFICLSKLFRYLKDGS